MPPTARFSRSTAGGSDLSVPCIPTAPIRLSIVADKLLKGEFHEIKGIMQKSRELGMKTFDHSLFELYNSLETEAAAPEATA